MDFGKDWDKKDTALLGAALSGIYADIESTKTALRRGGEEKNPLLSTNPSGQDLDKAGLLSGAIASGIAGMLSPSWRKRALGAYAGFEHGIAYKNRNMNPREERSGFLQRGMEGPLMMAALGGLLGHMMDDSSDVQIKPEEGGISILFKKGF